MKTILLLVGLSLIVSSAWCTPGCEEPQEAGMCRGYFPRFWFNAAKRQCEQFVYGGCGANANNYETEEKCKAACIAPEL
ncbi:kunitz-like toxin PcKuz1 [Babylonia areolata]|uniref:kunitz-like toxin PcKuz1 n=1 Tax=Babylonia areolata TaxID=304850 RepID=UPI003FD146BC